jgi:hypothetical protein
MWNIIRIDGRAVSSQATTFFIAKSPRVRLLNDTTPETLEDG